MLLGLGLVAGSLVLSACSELMPLNDAAPSYVKQVSAYKEGSDGLVVYIVLADSTGAMTTADGTLELTISEEQRAYWRDEETTARNLLLFSKRIPVSRSSFRRAKVGIGAYDADSDRVNSEMNRSFSFDYGSEIVNTPLSSV
jgi:hypothetical protein